MQTLGTFMNTQSDTQDRTYKRIGEFVVSFQWLENKLREIGWFILDPKRLNWPPKGLRKLTNEDLINKVHDFFLSALPKCALSNDLESDYNSSFGSCVETLHHLRRERNRILHSAYIEIKVGEEVQDLNRSNPRLTIDEETGEYLYDQEFLTPESFEIEIKKMGEAAMFLNRAYVQLVHRYPNGAPNEHFQLTLPAARSSLWATQLKPVLSRRGKFGVSFRVKVPVGVDIERYLLKG